MIRHQGSPKCSRRCHEKDPSWSGLAQIWGARRVTQVKIDSGICIWHISKSTPFPHSCQNPSMRSGLGHHHFPSLHSICIWRNYFGARNDEASEKPCLVATSGSHLKSTPKSQEFRLCGFVQKWCVCVYPLIAFNSHVNMGNIMIHLVCFPWLYSGHWKSPQESMYWNSEPLVDWTCFRNL